MRRPPSATIERSGRSGPRSGFTLLEVTLALALVGLVAGLALPRVLPNAGATALRIKALEIAALLRLDRNAALRTGRMVATAVDLPARRVRSGASGATIAVPATLGLRLATGASSSVRFFPDGTSSGGELFIDRSTLGIPNASMSVRVNDLTAAVSVRRIDAGRGG